MRDNVHDAHHQRPTLGVPVRPKSGMCMAAHEAARETWLVPDVLEQCLLIYMPIYLAWVVEADSRSVGGGGDSTGSLSTGGDSRNMSTRPHSSHPRCSFCNESIGSVAIAS